MTDHAPPHGYPRPELPPAGTDLAAARAAVRDFATAASRLCNLWQSDPFDAAAACPGPVDAALTATYPVHALSMSFDEIVAELWAWDEVLANHIEQQGADH